MEFMIDPSLMMRIAERYSDAQISDEKLRITGKSGDTKWEYITVLAAADDEHEEREPAPEKEKKGKGKREERDERD
jgi:hypothetical protein